MILRKGVSGLGGPQTQGPKPETLGNLSRPAHLELPSAQARHGRVSGSLCLRSRSWTAAVGRLRVEPGKGVGRL